MSDPTQQQGFGPPVAEVRIGRVKAAIWQNDSEGGVYHTVTFSRLYRTNEGDWRSSVSFRGHDLLLLAKVADAAHTRIFEIRSGQEENGGHE